ncbi:hypothetical protein CIB95_11820 [Lottiidibacillus patelloidae]|uniref:Uncharacterized protein n=1 Tax=Lottiidibacillus patelloidae TaxID=2670334 RepID=A0A263BTE5_9BACI|nr:hypothetical protein [Lottiidibacillus patelloidae]OZM56456.1 hypothetical protein CIB95_11820 [Lottiidibacillus patelloidae]
MAKRWSEEENAICLKSMPEYRMYMVQNNFKAKSEAGKSFTESMLQENSHIWQDRNRNSLYLHMKYLDCLTAGEKPTKVIKDQHLFGQIPRGKDK